MSKDMTKGNPFKLILTFAIPVLIGSLFQQFYSLVDTVIVGRFVGEDALAAVGSTSSLMFFVLGWCNGMTSGFAIMVSQKFGAGDEKGLKHFTGQSVSLSAIMSIIMTIALLGLNEPILRVMNTPANIFQDTKIYIGIIYAGLVTTIAYNLLAALLRALGDSKTPLYLLIISSIVNIILDLVFIINFQMGVAGAGLATVISQGISAVLCLIYVIKKYPLLHITKEDLKLKLQSVGRLIAIGTPMGLQFSITAIGTIIVQVSLNKLGSSYIAAFTACSKIQDISTQPFPSLGVALATYTGQNAGAGRIDRVKKGLNASALMTLISSVIVMVLIFAFGNRMVGIFSKETSAAMLAHCHTFFYEVVWFYPFLSLIFIYRNALQGLGYGLLPMLGGVAELIARMIVIAILAAPFGFAGICWAHPVAWISALIPIIPAYYYYVKKQESKQLS